jgi:hypothetical protein
MAAYEELRGRIEAVVLRWLPPGAQIENRLAFQITALSRYVQAQAAGSAYADAFRRTGKKKLEKFCGSLEKALDALDRLDWSARAALNLAGVELKAARAELQAKLESCRASVKKVRGPSKQFEHELVLRIAALHCVLTGKRPTVTVSTKDGKAGGDLYNFTSETLKALQLKQLENFKPEHALQKVRKKVRKKEWRKS